MPTVSMFFGITIRMYMDDHPPPHFHVHYGEHDASIDIDTLMVRRGYLPRRVIALVLEWAAMHREELRVNWSLAEAHWPLRKIEPLE